MQRYALTVNKFIDHAAKWHSNARIVSFTEQHGSERITYERLRTDARLLSGALIGQGLALGDRIATLAWNTKDHLTLYYAAMGAGLVCHTLNPRLSPAHLIEMTNEAQDRWIAVGAELQGLAAQLVEQCPSVEGVILLDGQQSEDLIREGVRLWTVQELLNRFGRETSWGDFEEEAAAGLCYTSGTIGRPRGVLYTHRSNYLHTLRALQGDAMALTASDTVLVAVPMFHANGWGLPFAAPAVGANMILPGRSTDPRHLYDLIVSEGVTVAAAVQTVWLGLVEYLDETGQRLQTLERVVIGGSHCPEALLRRLEEGLHARVQCSWGMTELSPLGTIEPPNRSSKAGPRTSGPPPMGLDVKLVDEDGVSLPHQRMKVGRVMVKGPSVADSYYNEPDTVVDAEGYFDTGDLGVIDWTGNLTITGRAKDLIKSGGEWINPREVEDLVGSLPEVGLVAVVSQSHPKWGERPVLVVEPSGIERLDESIVMGALRGKVPNWWLPDKIVVIDKMPLAATGKIDKKRLREDLGES